jgi:hypothetical protein
VLGVVLGWTMFSVSLFFSRPLSASTTRAGVRADVQLSDACTLATRYGRVAGQETNDARGGIRGDSRFLEMGHWVCHGPETGHEFILAAWDGAAGRAGEIQMRLQTCRRRVGDVVSNE